MQGLIVIVFLAAVIVASFSSIFFGHKRRQELQELARKLGFMYCAERDHHIDDKYRFLNTLRVGSNRYAFNIMSGVYEGYDTMVFDYHYQTGSGKDTHHHFFSFFIMDIEKSFPELLITKEHLFSKIGQALGFDDIDFESHEFSRKFCVRSKDKKFAYDFCNARMIEYLLANCDLNIEVEQNVLAVGFGRRLQAEEIEYNLNRMAQIRGLMPGYLF